MLTLTDIPYGVVNRENNGLSKMKHSDKGDADIETFDLIQFLEYVNEITLGTIIIFCAKEQLSTIYKYFSQQKGTVRQLIWEKTNPTPSNGQYVYLTGIENAVWFRKPKATFNAFCKNTVFRHPLGSSKYHPTEKNHKLLKELILDNSNEGDLVLDPCSGSGSTCLVANELNRNYLGIELNEDYWRISKERLENMNGLSGK